MVLGAIHQRRTILNDNLAEFASLKPTVTDSLHGCFLYSIRKAKQILNLKSLGRAKKLRQLKCKIRVFAVVQKTRTTTTASVTLTTIPLPQSEW